MRNVKTEYVSCPSCGRTLFDLQEVTEQIRQKTGHLPGVAIAVMGCIVNGPGEMADADFGYVGGAPGKIDLYVGKEVVKRAIPMDSVSEGGPNVSNLVSKALNISKFGLENSLK
jgi:(E)-4-hydroxy-3-methylbut-2-enyl-diphosphate synthase